MALDVSEAIALAKDLLETSVDFRPHDPVMAEQFSSRAYEICDDLGIDRAQIGALPADQANSTVVEESSARALVESAPADVPAEFDDEESRQTSEQLRNLLQQQALVLQHAREAEQAPEPKAKKRSFRLFGRLTDTSVGELQSA